jgi:hypothetical protein
VHAITLESKYGVPTVAIHTDIFRRLVDSVVRAKGMPRARYAFVPQPVMGKTPEQIVEYIIGNDPITGKPVLQEIVDGLTQRQELTEEDLKGLAFDRSTPRLLDADTEDNLHRLFQEKRWTDYLPIVLPTEERVAEMLCGTSHKATEVVGHMRPTMNREAWEYTVEKVAVNAVMAGARPEHLPVLLALAASESSARGSSTSSMSGMAVVNGPVRHELDMNCGIGAMGPYNLANSVIGRAWGLLSQNLQGGSEPGLTYMGSQGNGYAYNSLTFAENEERSPWEPFHAQHGFAPGDSTVSVFGGCRSTAFTLGLPEKHWRDHVRSMLRGMDVHSSPTFLLDPLTAKQFIDRGGFVKKEQLIEWVYENALIPAGEYWDYQLIQNYIYPRATFGEEPFASNLKAAPDELIHMFTPEEIHVVVVGGEANGYWRIMGANYRKTVSIDVWR